jgi:hypothetical protein
MASVAIVRIACDGTNFDGPVNCCDGRKITLWRGSDLRLDLAIFRRGILEDISNLAAVVVEIKPMGDRDTPPDVEVPASMLREVLAEEFNGTMELADWENGMGQQVTVEFSREETAIPPGTAWLVIWAKTLDEPYRIITLAAGRIAVRESAGGTPSLPPPPLEHFYDRSTCDTLFARRAKNLDDLANPSEARTNLGLGTAATAMLLDEDDMVSDSATAVPTQRSVRTYVGGAAEDALEDAKAYANGVAEDALGEAKAYVDGQLAQSGGSGENGGGGSGEGGSSNVPLATAESAGIVRPDNTTIAVNGGVLSGIFPGSGPHDYWPGSSRPLFFSYAARPYFGPSINIVSAMDGWSIYQSGTLGAQKSYFEAAEDGDAFLFFRSAGSTDSGTYYVNRGFSRREGTPLFGKTVTLAFELKFGTGFPLGVANKGIQVNVTSTTYGAGNPIVGGTGNYTSGHSLIGSMAINEGSTTEYQRHTFTFTVPTSSRAFCINMSHSPLAGAAPAEYKFFLRHPTLAIGESPADYRVRSWAEEYLQNSQRFLRIRSAFSGPVVAGEIYETHHSFPSPLEGNITSIRGYNETAPVGFAAANYADAVNVTAYGFTIRRTATEDNAEGKWQALYSFGQILWPFTNIIASY